MPWWRDTLKACIPIPKTLSGNVHATLLTAVLLGVQHQTTQEERDDDAVKHAVLVCNVFPAIRGMIGPGLWVEQKRRAGAAITFRDVDMLFDQYKQEC